MKKDRIGVIEGILIIASYLFCGFLGCMFGLVLGVYISCAITGNPLDMKYFGTSALNPWGLKLPILGVLIGGFCIGMPLFVLLVKPFYERKCLVELINKYGGSVNNSEGSARTTVNGLGWFWFNLLYPEKND